MTDVMDMTIDRLPAKTWYWLKMNDAPLSAQPPQAGAIPGPEALPQGLTWQENVSPEDWADMETGMGPDLDEFLSGGRAALLTAQAGVKVEAPILLSCTMEPGQRAGDRLFLRGEAGSAFSVLLLLEGEGDLSAVQVKIQAETEAKITLYVVQLLGDKAVCLGDVGVACGERAHVELIRLDLGGEKTYTGALAQLKGRESAFAAHVAYHVDGHQSADMNYTARHMAAKSESEMNFSGVLEDGAVKLLRDTIDFPNGCPGAKGAEQEQVLLMGERQVNGSIPLILCQEEDVEGAHGASIGRLEERTLFYLASRGLTREAAEDLVARARIEAVSEHIPSEEIREKIRTFWERKRGVEQDA